MMTALSTRRQPRRKPTGRRRPGDNPLDQLLGAIAAGPDSRARDWAAELLQRGEAADGSPSIEIAGVPAPAGNKNAGRPHRRRQTTKAIDRKEDLPGGSVSGPSRQAEHG
jgi:hypothetical protein